MKSKRLLIISIDIKRRKYVQKRLKNSDSFKIRSEIFNQNENDHSMRSKIAIQKKSNVRILTIQSY